MTKSEYAGYLQTLEWKEFRSARVEETPHCERCGVPRWLAEAVYDQDLHVHHKTYRNLGSEGREDVQVLCRRCHELETFGRSELRSPKEAKCELCGDRHWDYRRPFCPPCEAVLNGHLNRLADLQNPYFPSERLGDQLAKEVHA
jgi:hypothetical protein